MASSSCVEEIQGFIDCFEFDKALQLATASLQSDPDNIDLLLSLGNIQLELEDQSSALATFSRVLSLDADCADALLNTAQLIGGSEAIEKYERSLGLVSDQFQLSQIHCSIAEIFLTDCCDQEDAESACEKHLQLAISLDDKNASALLALINLRLVQSRNQEANSIFTRLQGIDEIAFESRLSLTRLAIELERFPDAILLCEQLVLEDDQVLDVFYLRAIAHWRLGQLEDALVDCREALDLSEEQEDPPMREEILRLQREVCKQ